LNININNIWPVYYKNKIDASTGELWKIISKAEHLNLVHPFCESNEIINWNGKGSIDVLTYLNGLTYFRNFVSWNEKEGYSLFIGRKRGKKSKVIWEIIEENESTYLKITVYPYLLSSISKFFSFLPHKIFVEPLLRNYLKSVVLGINYYLTNKKPVPRNHFGKHIWFSKFKT
tara:strand:- start:443 stop:961 length:519 start_codon:yes stop_codon:yes gene_type:complete